MEKIKRLRRRHILSLSREAWRAKRPILSFASFVLGATVLSSSLGVARVSAGETPSIAGETFALPVSASFTSVEIVDTYTCRGGNPSGPAPTQRPQLGGYGYCTYTSHGGDEFWGDLDGSTTYVSSGVVHSYGAIPYSAAEMFAGTVAGCGSGTFTFRVSGKIETLVLGEDGNYHDVGPWTIDVGSGTDGLASISGGGTVYTTIAPDFSSAWGTLAGTVNCL